MLEAVVRAGVLAISGLVLCVGCTGNGDPSDAFMDANEKVSPDGASELPAGDAGLSQGDAARTPDGSLPPAQTPDASTPKPQYTEPLAYRHTRPGNRSIHIADVNLCELGIELRATGPSDGASVVSTFANKTGAVLAVNGGHSWGGQPGPSAHDGMLFGLPDQGDIGQAILGNGFVDFVHMFDTYQHDSSRNREVLSGLLTLVHDGQIPRDVLTRDTPTCTPQHPRTLMGLTRDKKHLLLVAVDGRRNGVVGMTCLESAEYIKSLGAHWAINLDGGGSTTMWVDGKVVNTPSDGSQRTVPTHLAVLRKQNARTSCPGTPLPAKKPEPPPPPPEGCGRLNSGAVLAPNQGVLSCDGRFNFVHQTDGNIVLYQGGFALFNTQTQGNATSQLAMQGDGNLVLYSTGGAALWNSGTQGNPGAWLAVQDDGNAVIYSAAGSPLWSTNG